ncbi:FAD-binding oxidoreductase [bacterium]|nr:FAD-binding oxidoreductase [bacterium]
MSSIPDVIIVGGGIWGLSTALHLRLLSSASVCLLERNSDFGQETTINAAGQIGQIRSSPVVTGAIAYGLDFFESFPTKFGHEAGLVRCGSLFVAMREERLAYFQKQIALGRANGLSIESVDPKGMTAIVPGLRPEATLGGYFVHGDGYLDSIKAARAMAKAATARGAYLRRGVSVDGLIIEHGRVVGVRTNVGVMKAGGVIVTAGPWTSAIMKRLGVTMPLAAIRHQRARTATYRTLRPDHPVLRLPDLSSYVRPEEGGLTFGHFEANPTPINVETLSPHFRSIDLEPPIELLRQAQQEITKVYPDVGTLAVTEYCRAMITMAPDGAYAIGPVPGLEGLFAAGGCAALGIAGSAAIGKWLAQWALGQSPENDVVREFSMDRFDSVLMDAPSLEESACRAYASYYAIKT